MTSQRMPIRVRDDMEIREVPEEDRFKGRSIALAYTSPFGGAGVYLTPFDALGLSQALFNAAMQQIERPDEPEAGEVVPYEELSADVRAMLDAMPLSTPGARLVAFKTDKGIDIREVPSGSNKH